MLTILLAIMVGCGKKKEEKQYEEVGSLSGGPMCVIKSRVFRGGAPGNTVKEFAKSNGFRECEVPHYSIYSGPGYVDALYKNKEFVIWSRYPSSEFVHIAAHATNYSSVDFEHLTNALIMTLEKALPGQIEVNPQPQEPKVQGGISNKGTTKHLMNL